MKDEGFKLVQPVPAETERNPAAMRDLIESQRKQAEKDKRRERLKAILECKYKRRNAAVFALKELGLDVEAFDCPYAIEKQSDNPFTSHYRVVEDEDGQIKGSQNAQRKNIVGRVYAFYSGASARIKAKTGRCPNDPACDFIIVRNAQGYRIELREDKVAAMTEAIKTVFPGASLPDVIKLVELIQKIYGRAN